MRTATWMVSLAVAGLGWAVWVSGCDDLSTGVDNGVDEVEEILDSGVLEDVSLEQLAEIPICGNMSLEDLATSDTISDSCRDGIAAYLPDEQTSYRNVILTLGTEAREDGSLGVILQGADDTGSALTASAFASATVTVTIGGQSTVLGSGEYVISLVADSPGDLVSIGVVNDYSGSMLVQDLQTVAEIETDLFGVLPPVYEASIAVFSTDVTRKLDFTDNRDDLLSAVAYDAGYDRESTALYDGVGASLEALVLRDRPVRVLVVSTDGHENASETFTQSQLVSTIDQNGVIVVMLGALLADVTELKTLAGERGVYFYTPYYSDMRALMAGYLDSLGELVELVLPPEYANADSIQIEVGDQVATVQP